MLRYHRQRPPRKRKKSRGPRVLPQPEIVKQQGPSYNKINEASDIQTYIKQKVVLKKYKKRQRWDAILDRLPQGVHLVGAEIGVLRANTAHRILVERPLLKHYMIDPWCVPEKGSSYDKSQDTNAQKSQEQHDADYRKTVELTRFAGKRAVIIRKMSHEVIDQFEDGFFDFVFIDGDHSYDGVKLDIKLWLSKVKKGGWIGGHDYDHPKLPGVKRAVDEAFTDKNIELDDNRTWFVRL
jgi:hypothetical protein